MWHSSEMSQLWGVGWELVSDAEPTQSSEKWLLRRGKNETYGFLMFKLWNKKRHTFKNILLQIHEVKYLDSLLHKTKGSQKKKQKLSKVGLNVNNCEINKMVQMTYILHANSSIHSKQCIWKGPTTSPACWHFSICVLCLSFTDEYSCTNQWLLLCPT